MMHSLKCTVLNAALTKKEEKRRNTMEDFPIYFSDLNEEAQKRLLNFIGADEAKDMNWDVDICPLAYYPNPALPQSCN